VNGRAFRAHSGPDVDIVVCEVLCCATQTVEIPGSVTRIAEKDLAHVVVDAMDMMALAIEMFTASEPMRPLEPVTKTALASFEKFASPFEIGPATNIMRQISRI